MRSIDGLCITDDRGIVIDPLRVLTNTGDLSLETVVGFADESGVDSDVVNQRRWLDQKQHYGGKCKPWRAGGKHRLNTADSIARVCTSPRA